MAFPACASCGEPGEDGERHDDATGLVRGHAYTVLGAWALGAWGQRVVKLRNPWGYACWKGPPVEEWQGCSMATKARLDLGQDENADGIFWMKYGDFLNEFSALSICRVRLGYFSCSFDISPAQPLAGQPLATCAAVLTLPEDFPSSAGVSLSMLQSEPAGDRAQPLFAGVGLQVFELSDSEPVHLATSAFAARREVSVDARVRPGGRYLVVASWRAGGASARGCRLCVYGPGIVRLTPFAGDLGSALCSAYEAAAQGGAGEQLLAECGAKVLTWRDPEGRVTAFLLDGGASPSGLAASFSWTLRNVLLQTAFPGPAEEAIVTAAAAGREYSHDMLAEVRPGQRRLVVLSWVDPEASSSVAYAWQAGANPCLECGAPVGPAVPGRFSGKYFTPSGGSSSGSPAGAGKVHEECFARFRARRASACLHCGEPVVETPGRFDGRFFKYDEAHLGAHSAGQVHAECNEAWRARWAQTCLHCGRPVMSAEGAAGARFFEYQERALGDHPAGRVHAECNDPWRARWSPACLECGEPVMQVEGTFSGRFYEYPAQRLGDHGPGQVHAECHEAWQRRWAAACLHCGGPMAQVDGQFSGRHVVLERGPLGKPGVVHEECHRGFLVRLPRAKP